MIKQGEMDKLKPTPTKISMGSLIATIILTVVFIVMESYKGEDMNEMYMTCYTSTVQRRGNYIKVMFLTCKRNPIRKMHRLLPVTGNVTSNISNYWNDRSSEVTV